MIVKSMSRKTISFGQLLEYINAPERTGSAILQNLRTTIDDTEAIQKEFLDNARYLPPRKNGNILYHEVLSFSDADHCHLTPAILENLLRRYLELRAPYALAYGKAHFDCENPHIHVLISANNVGSSRRLRLPRSRFAGVKRELEAYQREHYPFLEASVVFKPAGDRMDTPMTHQESSRKSSQEFSQESPPECRKESERFRRLGNQEKTEPSRKELIRRNVLEQLTAARSAEAFFLRLKLHGLRLYRRGRTVSVQDMDTGRRYRLKTLGMEQTFKEALRQWKLLPERLQDIQDAELERAQQSWHEMGFRDEIRDALLLLEKPRLSSSEQTRLQKIHRMLSEDRAHERDSRSIDS